MPLPFFIVQDHKENPRKCTALPLRDLPGIELVRLRRPRPREELSRVPGGVWLTVDAPPLSPDDRDLFAAPESRVVVLDGSWARVPAIERRITPAEGARVERRSLPAGWVTAYPRVSKLFEDPAAGLATVEAMWVAALILGRARADLFGRYRWADEFLRRNAAVIDVYGAPAASSEGDSAGIGEA